MNPIEIRKSPDGFVYARRIDGQPLTHQDREAAQRMAFPEELRPAGSVIAEFHKDNGEITAILICSDLLEDKLWLLFDRSFEPHDGLAIYYADEIPALKDKRPEELAEIHKVKLTFPGARVIQ